MESPPGSSHTRRNVERGVAIFDPDEEANQRYDGGEEKDARSARQEIQRPFQQPLPVASGAQLCSGISIERRDLVTNVVALVVGHRWVHRQHQRAIHNRFRDGQGLGKP